MARRSLHEHGDAGHARRRRAVDANLPHAREADQLTLLDEKKTRRARPRARATDPQTSHRAAERAENTLTLKQLAVLDLFRWLEPFVITPIDERVVFEYRQRRHVVDWYPAQSESGLRTRRHELVERGYLEDSGEKGKTSGGSPSIRWRLTQAGRDFDINHFRAIEYAREIDRNRDDHL